MSKIDHIRYFWREEGLNVLLVLHMWCLQCAYGELVALSVIGKPATQTGFPNWYPASNAVDGSTGTFSHTANVGDPHPWWRVDLETEHCVGKITVKLRQFCCGQFRFTGTVVRAGGSPNYTKNQPCGLPATTAQSSDGAVNDFLCDPPRMARYVTLDIDPSRPKVTDAVLMLAEVTVEKYTSGECPANNDSASKFCRGPKTGNFKRLYEEGLIGNLEPLSTEDARSLPLCAVFCTTHAHCFFFDFAPTICQCRLHGLNTSDIVVTPSVGFSVYGLLQ